MSTACSGSCFRFSAPVGTIGIVVSSRGGLREFLIGKMPGRGDVILGPPRLENVVLGAPSAVSSVDSGSLLRCPAPEVRDDLWVAWSEGLRE